MSRGSNFNCENCVRDGQPCRYVCFTLAQDPFGIASKACIRCGRNGNQKKCRIISMTPLVAKEAGKGGIRLYAGETPEDKWWGSSEQGREARKKGDEQSLINFRHYQRCLEVHRLSLLLGFDKPNPAIYGHDTMTAKEKDWMRKHQAQRKLERGERQKLERNFDMAQGTRTFRPDSTLPLLLSRAKSSSSTIWITSRSTARATSRLTTPLPADLPPDPEFLGPKRLLKRGSTT